MFLVLAIGRQLVFYLGERMKQSIYRGWAWVSPVVFLHITGEINSSQIDIVDIR